MIYFGIIEERSTSDKFKVGRCKVRIFGIHTENKSELPTFDLPWAIPLQGITSAANSGIGDTPLGLVEGTWVAITFADENKQQPIILGSIAGVPFASETNQNQDNHEEPVVPRESEGSVVTDASGEPVKDESGNPIVTDSTTPKDLKHPQELQMTDAGKEFIMNEEALSSLTKGRNDFRKKWQPLPDNTPIYSYQDTGGVWAIGFGSTYLGDNSRVGPDTVLTKALCMSLFSSKLEDEYVKAVKRNLTAPVTQGMFEATVSMAYNIGYPRLIRSQYFTALNAARYDEAAALIPMTYAKNLGNRRAEERKWFERNGFPNSEGKLDKTPEQILQKDVEDKKAGTYIKPFSYTEQASTGDGFKDPNGVYPLDLNEPDTNRLARVENINETIIARKDAGRIKSVKTSIKDLTWSQPPVPYNPTWPYNYVKQTERGHIEEFDDSKNNERYHRWHKSGTYEEIDTNGTKVNRIVGDSYEILDRDGHLLIKGNCFITIAGDANIRVENDANLEILGDMKTKVSGHFELAVKKSIKIKAKEEITIESEEADVALQGINVQLNSDIFTDLELPEEESEGAIELPKLTTPTRKAMFNANYETPEEGSPTVFHMRNIKEFDEEEVKSVEDKPKEEVTAPPKVARPIPTDCEALTDEDIKPQYVLSPLFKLGDVLTGSSGYPKGLNYGLTAAQIVCNIKKLTVNCLDNIKSKYPNMRITNTWRSQSVNTRIGGSKTSDHLTGCAADIQLSGFSREQHYNAIIEIQKLLPAYRQLILEYKGSSTWIHVSFKEGDNKCQNLTIDAGINKTIGSGKFVLIGKKT